jgi:protein-S-isoprenylcysteine O-methyltransferase Ste14
VGRVETYGAVALPAVLVHKAHGREVLRSSAGHTALVPCVQPLRWGAPRERMGDSMRRVALVLAAMALALILAAGWLWRSTRLAPIVLTL